MATAADSTAYGGGAGGKFRTRPFRRTQTTPYDRPLTALRRTWRNSDSSNGGGGWLSRIVDPASKLISAGAYRLFSSVFRKRLPPPPQPSPDEKVGPLENHLGDAITEDPSQIQERERNEGNTQNNDSAMDGVAELEQLLKQKTFTRSEIDRLTVVLHSRTVDKTGFAGQGRLESTPSEPAAGHSRQELDGTACENVAKPSEVLGADFTPAGRSKVNGDVASPAELAKSYMGSGSTRVSPSMLGSRSQAVREEMHALTTFQLHRPNISTVQKPLSTTGTSQNDFVVPRSRGRSAIYNMARTPYSRVPPSATKGSGTSSDAFDERSVLSSHKALKRRCSVLENDIGAVGPIRRIRQKSNLLYSKNLGLPSSRTPLANVTPSEVGEASLYSSSKSQEDRGDMGIPVSSSQISSRSMEMGQRILQQLEKMTPPKEISSENKPGFSAGMSAMKLTPAMLRGQALKSLETANSLKYLQSDQVGDKKVDSLDVALHEVRDSTSKKLDKVYDISSNVTANSSNKVYPENNEAGITDNDVMVIAKPTAPVVLKSAVDVPKKSRAFQMSAYEDCLELDDDVHSHEVASSFVNEGKRNLEPSSIQSNGNMLQENQVKTTKADTPPAFPALKSSSDLVLKNTALESSTLAEKGIDHSFPTDSVSNKGLGSSAASLLPVTTSVSDNADIPASTISFGLKSSDKVSAASFFSSSAVDSSIPKDAKSQCPTSVFNFAAGATDATIKSPGSNNKSTEALDLFKKSDNTSPSSLRGAFGQSNFTASTGNTGVPAMKVGGDAAGTATATTASINGSSNSLTSSVAFPSIQPGLTFRGSTMASDSAVMASSGTDIAEKSKETAFGNSTSSSLSGAASAAAPPSSTTASFQFGVSNTSGTNNQLPSTTASASTTETMPSQSVGLALPASSGSSSLLKSGVDQFGPLTSASSPFSSSSTFGSSPSGSSSVAASGSAISATANIFGSSSQPSNSPVFGSVFNTSSSGPSFGASSASTLSSNASSGFAFGTTPISAPVNGSSAGVTFGASSALAAAGSSSSYSGFSFGASSASYTPTSSVSPGLAFGTTSANGSTAGVAFGASPTAAAADGSTSSVFAFGSSSSASSISPLSSFSFGASSASASTSASSSTPLPSFSFGASSASSSSAPSSTFSFGASSSSASTAPSSTFLFGASSVSASSAPSSTFSFGASPASSSAPSSSFSFGASSASSSAPSSTFSFRATPASASSSAPTSAFLFGASSVSATTTPASIFSSQPAFGNGTSMFAFGSTPSPSPLGNNDQMTVEDTMAEDSTHSPAAPASVFGQSPTSNFGFGMAPALAPAPALALAPSGANPFQFGSQQSQVAGPQNPFQNSGSFDGGSFSLGAVGNDKSNRRIVKVRSRNRKK